MTTPPKKTDRSRDIADLAESYIDRLKAHHADPSMIDSVRRAAREIEEREASEGQDEGDAEPPRSAAVG